MTRELIMSYLIFGELLAFFILPHWKMQAPHRLIVLYLALMTVVVFWPMFVYAGLKRR